MTPIDHKRPIKRGKIDPDRYIFMRRHYDFVRPEELTKSEMYEMLADAARRTAKLPKKRKENRHV